MNPRSLQPAENPCPSSEIPMGDRCPHCDAKLPHMRDGFCGECRSDLSEPAGGSRIAAPSTPPQRPMIHPRSTAANGFRQFRWFFPAFYALAIVCGIRNIHSGESSRLDLLYAVVFAIVLGWWAIVDARRRRQPIPMLARPWFFLLAGLVVPGYVIWSRGWLGLGYVVLHSVLWYALATVVMHAGGWIVFGDDWPGPFKL